MADPKQPTQQELDDAAAKLKEAETKLKELETEVKKLAKSNDRRTVLEIIARKTAVIGPYLTPLGLLKLSVEEIEELKEELSDNFDRLKDLVEAVADFLVVLVEGIIDVIGTLVKKIISIIERQTGKGEVQKTAANTIKMSGATNNLRLLFSDILQEHGLPPGFGPLEGSWQAEAAFYGTDAEGNDLYKLTAYSSETPALIMGPAQVEGIQQVMNIERDSIFTFKKDGSFSGKMYTRFLADSWGEDDVLGVPCTSRINGKVQPNNMFTYSAEGEEFLWASYLVPGLTTVQP